MKLSHLTDDNLSEKLELEQQIDFIIQQHTKWMEDKGYDPEEDACVYCFGEAYSLEHDVMQEQIDALKEELVSMP